MAFDLGEALKGVSYQGAGREQIEYIRLDRLDEDPNNFYQLSDIDQLAARLKEAQKLIKYCKDTLYKTDEKIKALLGEDSVLY